MQSLLSAIYPILKENYGLDFVQIGLLTFTFQVTASLLQPTVGLYTDKQPLPYSLAVGMGSSLVGLLGARRCRQLLAAPAAGLGLVGHRVGDFPSGEFEPRGALASGGRHGLAQSLFQVGGNVGSAVGPLLAAFVVLRTASAASRGSRPGRWWGSSSCGGSAPGTPAHRRANAGQDAGKHHAALRRAHDDDRARRPDRADGDQERLHGEPFELLHVLPDREVQCRRAGQPAAAVRLSGCIGARACSSAVRSATGSAPSS